MARGQRIETMLRPLSETGMQAYLGTGLHVLGLLDWILSQTGPAHVYLSTFSTSEQFLNGFLRLRKKGLILYAAMLADLKASRKTVNLAGLMRSCFDNVYLSQNHSKIILVFNDTWNIAVVTSQNQTYGDRAEATVICTDRPFFNDIYRGFSSMVNDKSYRLDGLFCRDSEENRGDGIRDDGTDGGGCAP